MKKNRVSFKSIQYELRNIGGNPFIHIFGIGMPLLMAIIIPRAVTPSVHEQAIIKQIVTSIVLGLGTMVTMATMLIGYASQSAEDMEKEIPMRMKLFGFKERYIIINRLIAEFIYMTFAYIIYFSVTMSVNKMITPTVTGMLIYMLAIYSLGIICFLFSHAVVNIVKKFGLTYMITMIIFFAVMILSGMMGIEVEKLPKGVQTISKMLPTTYINGEFYHVWTGEHYNYGPMIQAYIFIIAITGILLFIMQYREKRNLH